MLILVAVLLLMHGRMDGRVPSNKGGDTLYNLKTGLGLV